VKNWVSELKEFVGEDIIIAVVGNKLDLDKHQPIVDYQTAYKYCKSINSELRLVSAKENKGI
jgi:GTPase SAR1 family protein